jgi:hypothetical protein
MDYPKSQIKTNLYTSGWDEPILYTTPDFTQVYIGYFYSTSSGEKFTGKSPVNKRGSLLFEIPKNFASNDPNEGSVGESQFPKKRLREIYTITVPLDSYGNISDDDQPSLNEQYMVINNITTTQPTLLPSPNSTTPTQPDYKLGEFQRYFAKKNNELIYIEIDKQTQTLLLNKSERIAWDMYTPLTLTWTLTGEQEKVFLVNKKIVALAEKQNKWYGFSQWFKDNFLKYYLAS